MPEPPDFEYIAVGILNRMGLYDDVVTKLDIAEQLRQVWNARGAADIAKVEVVFLDRVPAGSPTNIVLNDLDRALRSLDR